MKIKEKSQILFLALFVALILSGCAGDEPAQQEETSSVGVEEVEEPVTGISYTIGFDKSMFYQNVAGYSGADPAMLYVEDGEYAGTFFMYVTSGSLGARGFMVYSSQNLTDWETAGVAFMSGSSWGSGQYWAPEVIYDDGRYYMFYSANWGSKEYTFYISAAVSDSPVGPFEELTTENKSADEPLLIFENHIDEIPAEYVSEISGYLGKEGYIKVIDASPFIDPVSGKKYLYFVADIGTDYTESSFIFGMEMEDWATPKYETLTKLTSYGYTTVDETTACIEGGETNEGPFMYYEDGVYYLTFSTNTYYTVNYQVHQALGSSPLGPFEKVDESKGGTVIYTDSYSLPQATGHHTFVKVGDELWASYHVLANDENIDDGRMFAVDKAVLVENEDGVKVLKINGPTRTPQPLPEALTGYENVAVYAVASCEEADNDIELVNDGYVPMHKTKEIQELRTVSGNAVISLDFESAVSLRSIIVYNSTTEKYMFDQVSDITIYTDSGNYNITNLAYDTELRNYTNLSTQRILYDLAATAVIDQLEGVRKVTFTFDQENAVGIPEIMLMGTRE